MKDQLISRKLLRIILFLLAFIWFFGIISYCFDFNSLTAFYPFQKQIYSTVCHQNINKSFTCNGIPFFVCARCTGIYSGVLIAALIILFLKKPLNIKTYLLLLFSLPMLTDVILVNIGVYNYNRLLSAFTGLLFGSVVFLYILEAIENLLFRNHTE
ncbi:MAG TPA: hypothetical protein DHV28_18340 [Ignavibacteriales bacterium]|nr:hypothetical protein [Ignavibacteriales bacterium]